MVVLGWGAVSYESGTPALTRKRKDLVAESSPLNQVYVYKKYYLRTSKSEYSLDNMQDLFIHLTNYAVQNPTT